MSKKPIAAVVAVAIAVVVAVVAVVVAFVPGTGTPAMTEVTSALGRNLVHSFQTACGNA